MPKITPIAELFDKDNIPDKATVMSVRGKLTHLWKVTRGDGNDGPYEFQNGTIEDETGSIKIVFANNTQPESARNKIVTLSCNQTQSFGWQGLKVEDKGYTDKNENWVEERQLKVTGAATVDYGDGGASSGGHRGGGQQQPQGGGQQSRTQHGPKTGPKQPPQQPNGGGQRPPQQQQQPARKMETHPQIIIGDILALHKHIHAIVNDNYPDVPDETKAAYVATLYIESNRQGVGLDFAARNAKPLAKRYPAPPSDPSKWAECVMPWGKETEGKTLSEIGDSVLLQVFHYFDNKKENTPLAECVYAAAEARGVLPPPKPPAEAPRPPHDPDLDAAPDDIPF